MVSPQSAPHCCTFSTRRHASICPREGTHSRGGRIESAGRDLIDFFSGSLFPSRFGQSQALVVVLSAGPSARARAWSRRRRARPRALSSRLPRRRAARAVGPASSGRKLPRARAPLAAVRRELEPNFEKAPRAFSWIEHSCCVFGLIRVRRHLIEVVFFRSYVGSGEAFWSILVLLCWGKWGLGAARRTRDEGTGTGGSCGSGCWGNRIS